MPLDHFEEPLPVPEMIPIRNGRHVRISWSIYSLSQPIDLLLCSHDTHADDWTAPWGTLNLALVTIGATLTMSLFIVMGWTQSTTCRRLPLPLQTEPPV